MWDKSKSALILNDNAQLNFGTNEDGDIYHDNTQMIINNATGTLRIRSSEVRLCNPTNATYFTGTSGGSAKLYHNDSVKLETTSSGATVTGELHVSSHIDVGDSDQIRIGDSDDLKLYHASNQSVLQDNYGDLRICGNVIRFRNGANSYTAMQIQGNGATTLYYSAGARLSTTSDGVTISGTLTVDGEPFIRNKNAITTSVTLTTAHNHMSAGPITINSGVTVTVNSGATWTVV